MVDLSPLYDLRHFVGIPTIREEKQGITNFPCVFVRITQRSRFPVNRGPCWQISTTSYELPRYKTLNTLYSHHQIGLPVSI